MLNDVIELEYESEPHLNDIGEMVRDRTFKEIYAERLSIKQSEFYQAAASGFKPEIRFKINLFEYEGNKRLKYKGIFYNIIRNFETSLEKVELICEGDVNASS